MTGHIVKIARKELVTVYRSRVIMLNAAIILLLLLVAASGGYKNYHTVKNIREQAQQEKRQQWLNQDPKHPHIAAHFGTFAYKPKTWLSMMDPGLDNYAGAYAYLEPHRQNDFVFKPAEGYSGAIRFGQLSVALVLQLLVPLLIIFMGFASITHERDNGTLKLLLSSGVPLYKIAAGKVLGLFTALLIILLPALFLTGLFFGLQAPAAGDDRWLRIGMLVGVYCIYFFLFTLTTVFVSAISKTAGNALLTLLSIWIVGCIILPKAAANMGSNRYPLPSQYAFREAIQHDIANGINGHNTKDERAKQLEEQLLKQYHVSSVKELPFNFEGYVMQAGEEYSSMVYDKYFHSLQETLIKQDQFCRIAGIIDPFLSVQGISMGLAATDIYTHIDFQQHTEVYRRKFVQQMNEDMKHNSRLGDWNYKSSRKLYASVPDFRYTIMPVGTVLSLYSTELISLLVLLSVSVTLFCLILKRIPAIKSL
jgi:ABC-2 type transport system permease protein